MEVDDKRVGLKLDEILAEESILKKILVSVASATLAALVLGSIILYKEFIQIQDWTKHHDAIATLHIGRINDLEVQARKGGRWTSEDHNRYAERQTTIRETHEQRLDLLERSKDLTEFKLEAMDGKLDEIIAALKTAVEERKLR